MVKTWGQRKHGHKKLKKSGGGKGNSYRYQGQKNSRPRKWKGCSPLREEERLQGEKIVRKAKGKEPSRLRGPPLSVKENVGKEISLGEGEVFGNRKKGNLRQRPNPKKSHRQPSILNQGGNLLFRGKRGKYHQGMKEGLTKEAGEKGIP